MNNESSSRIHNSVLSHLNGFVEKKSNKHNKLSVAVKIKVNAFDDILESAQKVCLEEFVQSKPDCKDEQSFKNKSIVFYLARIINLVKEDDIGQKKGLKLNENLDNVDNLNNNENNNMLGKFEGNIRTLAKNIGGWGFFGGDRIFTRGIQKIATLMYIALFGKEAFGQNKEGQYVFNITKYRNWLEGQRLELQKLTSHADEFITNIDNSYLKHITYDEGVGSLINSNNAKINFGQNGKYNECSLELKNICDLSKSYKELKFNASIAQLQNPQLKGKVKILAGELLDNKIDRVRLNINV